MSRSKHTDPKGVRAARRVRAPRERRGHGDLSTERAWARSLKEIGIVCKPAAGTGRDDKPAPLPRIKVKRPRRNFFHPAGKREITRVLRFFGETCTYGLRSVDLVQAGGATGTGPLRFGSLKVPGRIILYEQQQGTWLLLGTVPGGEAAKLQRAGAEINVASGGLQTSVSWPGQTLRDFMLFDVFMHEIGHHLIQQYKGKRRARVARTKDHEAFAERFAHQCRIAFGQHEFES